MNKHVDVKVTYKGKKVGRKFFDDNPELRDLYLKKEDFLVPYLKLLDDTLSGMSSTMLITEDGKVTTFLNDSSL